MSGHPFISVVIPCFNYARYVGLAISTALAQTYPHREVVVVNDGSSDASPSVIARYANRIELVDQANQGMIAAWHSGFARSQGDIVLFLDADDLLEPEALARVAEAWSPEVAKVQFDLRIIDEYGVDLGRRFCNFPRSYTRSRVRDEFERTGTYVWPVTVGNAYSRWFLQATFPLTVDMAPEGALNTVAPLYGDIVTVAQALGAYRIHGANSWSSTGIDVARLPHRINNRHVELDLLRLHAERCGVSLPEGSVLDHELPFINYRLLAWKFGLEYRGKSADSPRKLLAHGLRVALRTRYATRAALAHAAWFVALFASPPPAARLLLRARFGRGAVRSAFVRRVPGVLRHPLGRRAGSVSEEARGA
jgi:glycosyltransferase involved in cell wall biosynthesis